MTLISTSRSLVLAALLLAALPAAARPPRGGRPPDAQSDRETFHYLLEHRAQITRSVEEVPGGVRTVTESTDPAVAARIRAHVASMKKRLQEGRPIHRRDPLFAALFAHADRIDMKVDDTPHGARVTETSSDPATVALLREHAAVVSRFLAVGWPEVQRNHPVPAP